MFSPQSPGGEFRIFHAEEAAIPADRRSPTLWIYRLLTAAVSVARRGSGSGGPKVATNLTGQLAPGQKRWLVCPGDRASFLLGLSRPPIPTPQNRKGINMKASGIGLQKGRIIRWSMLPVVLALWVVGAPAHATDMVPSVDSLQMSVTQSTDNPDGTTDQVLEGTGVATHLGEISLRLEIRIQPAHIDTELWAMVSDFSGKAVETAANGDTLVFSIVGREILFYTKETPPSPIFPFHVEAVRKVTEGSGRFENATGTITFTGTDEDYIISGVSTGKVSSVGANKR